MLSRYSFLINSLFVKNKNIKSAIAAVIFSGVGALMEGSSYGVLIITFAAITKSELLIPEFIPFQNVIKNLPSDQLLIFSLILAVICQGVRSFFVYLSSLQFAKITEKGMTYLLKSVSQQMMTLSYRSIHHYKIGEITELISSIPLFFSHWIYLLSQITSNFLVALVAIVILMVFSAKLVLVVLSIFAFSGLIQRLLIKKLCAISIEVSSEGQKVSSATSQLLSGIRQIHTFGFQTEVKQKMDPIFAKISTFYKKMAVYNGYVISLNELISIVAICAMVLVCFFILLADESSNISLLLGFMPIALRLAMKIAAIANFVAQMTSIQGKFDGIRHFIDPSDKEYIDQSGFDLSSFNESIYFDNVTFSYPEKNVSTISNCTFEIKKGCVTAFVGDSGSGKSTILDLILKFYSPKNGAIYIDGKNLEDVSLNSWRSLIGVVSQDPFIFHDTIEFNIKMGNPKCSPEDIINASLLAGAHEFIKKLENGYQTLVGERGHKLSGGERQRLSLARALIRNPQILILDEATSNLDSESESLIQQSLEKLRDVKTIIVVAHRLSTVVNADSILVVQNGKVIESGTHESLLQNNGKYSKFWKLQYASSLI